MEVSLKTLEGDKVQAEVVIDKKDVDNAINKKYKSLAKKYNFPGFRKGKAPRPVIDNALGQEFVLASVAEELINDAYPVVIEDQKLFPVGNPDFGDTGTVESGKDFKFEFVQGIKPNIELTSYDPVEVELPPEGATDEEVEEQIKTILDHYKSFENASAATKLKEGESADIDLKAKNDKGEEIESLTRMAAVYTPGSSLYSEAFDKEVLGMKKGETKEFKLSIPEDESALLFGDIAGQDIDFTVVCNSVLEETTPELTDEWVRETLGFDDIAAMKEQVKESIAEQKKDFIPRMKENLCALKLVERVDMDVPDAMVEQMESQLLQDFFTQLQRQGMNFDNYLMQQGINSAQFKEDVKHQAEDEVKQELALDAWARNKGIEATDEDIIEQFVKAGVPEPEKVQKEWKDNGRLYLIREGVIRSKAMQDVMDSAKVTEIKP